MAELLFVCLEDFQVDCRKFVEQGCLSFTVASLSSRDAHIRQAGYHVLSRYMMHLEGARFKERKQVSTEGHSVMCAGKRNRRADRQTDRHTHRHRDSQIQTVRWTER